MKALVHITLTGLLLPCFGLGFYYGLGGASGHPNVGMLFAGFIMLPVATLFIWPWLLAFIVGSAAVCSLAARASFRRLSAWFLWAAIVGAAVGVTVVTAMSLPRPWVGAIAGLLAAVIGTYPLHDVWISSNNRNA